MVKFNKCKLNSEILDQWVKTEVNVLLIGEKGVGKTSHILSAFERNKLKYAYFSGSTLDPWIHLLGIPKAKIDENGKEKMSFVLPENLDDDVEAIYVDEYNRCFVGSTQIQLADGYSVPIRDLVNVPEFFVYSYDLNNKKTAIGRAHSCRLTQKNAPILKVTLDDGSFVRCTPNHKFLCSDNIYREAKDLSPNQSLMAMYKKYNRSGYEEVKSTIESSWKYTYWLADEYNVLNNKYSTVIEENRVSRHHVNGDKYNNNPNNIVRMDYLEHIRYHGNDKKSTSVAGKNAHIKNPNLYSQTIGQKASKEKALRNSLKTRKQDRKNYLLKLSKNVAAAWTDDMKKAASVRAMKQWQNGQFNNINRKKSLQKTHLNRTCKILFEIINKNSVTLDEYESIYKNNKHSFSRTFSLLTVKKINSYFDNDFNKFSLYYKDFIDNDKPLLNHRVVSVIEDGVEDVYDFTVDAYHNFLLGNGIFVHNCNKVVRNALLELQQFKSINGRKFPKLKMVWGAVNPPKGDDDEGADYDVDELDPAQLDRFHVVVELPNEPDVKYFRNKFGDYHGKILVDWWHDQPKDALKILSPRRLDYVGECFKKGLDVKFLLPVSANVKELVKKLSMDEKEELINMLLNKPDEEQMKMFFSDEKNVLKYKKRLKEPRFWKYWKYAKKELLTDEVKSDENFENYALYQALIREQTYRDVFVEIAKSNPKNQSIKILKALIDQNYVPEKNDISNFISSEPNFTILKPVKNVVNDTFNIFAYSWLNITLPKTFDPHNSIYNLNTTDRRRGLQIITQCWHVVQNKHHMINFVLSCLISMQKATITSDKNFLNVFGTICKVAKETLKPDQIQKMIEIIKLFNSKLSSNRVADYVNYLSNNTECVVIPESFMKKLRDIRSVLAVSESKNDIIDLLQL